MRTDKERHTEAHPCPVCGGYDGQERGQGVRCGGYTWTAADGQRFAVCTRDEYKGQAIKEQPNAGGWLHRLDEPGIVAKYDYKDERGNLIFQAVRYEPKGFKQRRPDRRGGWINNLDDTRRVLYCLPELVKADPQITVYIPEGEKDVDALTERGCVATCNPMGAGKWRREYSEHLSGRSVVILPDNDRAGMDHARQVANSLFGIAASVKIVELPGLPEKGDVSDWLTAGGTSEQLAALAGEAGILDSRFPIGSEEPNRAFLLTPLSQLFEEPEEETACIWDKTLPASGLSILAAKPKVGKSTLARNLAVAVAKGEPFLSRETAKGPVIYLALEEKRSALRSQFIAMGAPSEGIYVYTGGVPDDAIGALADAIVQVQPALVVVDPLLSLLRLTDVNDYAQVRNALEPLIQLARSSGAHIMALHHMGKGERAGSDAVLGSTALFGGVDTLLAMKRTDDIGRSLTSEQRYGTNFPETVVLLDEATGIIRAGGDMASLRLANAKEAVLSAMGKEALTEAEIRERVGGNQTDTARAIRALAVDTQLERTGTGKKDSPFLYQRWGATILQDAA